MACLTRYAAVCGVTLALVAAPPAQGSVVGRSDPDGAVFYFADPGEDNQLTIESTPGPAGFHILTDPGAVVTAEPPCATDGTTAVCPAQPGDFVFAELIDGADSVVSNSEFRLVACAGGGVDTMTGGEPGDTLRGEAGGDTIAGRGGADFVNADDPCDPSAPAPTPASNDIDGGAGADQLIGGAAADTIDAGEGGDEICGGDGGDTLTGGDGEDFLIGEGGHDSLAGEGDDDFILTEDPCITSAPAPPPSSNDADGGAGEDIFSGGAGADTMDGGEGDDSMCAGDGVDPVTGGAGDDFVAGEGGSDTLAGNAGNDFLSTEIPCAPGDPLPPPSFNAVTGGLDNDTVAGGAGVDSIDTGDGDDSVCAGEGNDPIAGGDGEDFLLGEAGSDSIDAGAADDFVITEAFCDSDTPIPPPSPNDVEGGAGADALIGGNGADAMDGGDGDDSVFGARVDDGVAGDVEDQLTGGEGDDALVGHDGADDLDGGNGADQLAGGNGDDDVFGGPGDDALGRTVNQSFTDSSGQLQTVTTVDNGDDLLDAGTGNDLLNGSIGEVVLNFGLEGSIGAFETSSPNGADDFIGGADRDTVTFVNMALPVHISPDGVANDGSSGEGDNVRPDNEVLVGGSSHDTLIGTEGPDTLDGGKGDDRIDGIGGDDVLRGGATDGGADEVKGGAGADSVAGGPGDDRLDGQAGPDELDGGGGGDTAVGGDDSDSVSGGAGLDVIAGGAGDDRLRGATEGLIGADGADTLRGDEGIDDLDGGPGDDTLAGGRGADVLAGAEGADTADYADAGGRVRAKLDGLPGDGQAGEGDLIQADVEGLRGGSRGDTLIGNRGENTISGGGGGDYVNGRRGADRLAGDGGRDTIRSRDRSVDRVACGRRRDSAIVDELDRVGGDCERILEGGRRRPVLGRSMVVRPLKGSTAVRLPGSPRAIPLEGPEKVPLGSVLDARDGVVRVTTARGRVGTQAGVFSEGRFSVRQRRSLGAGATLRLRGGDFSDCEGDEIVRRLHGRGAGEFRTASRNSVTTTARASWVVKDRCDGTLTRVRSGEASVLDLGLGERTLLTRGESYLARAR